MKTIAVRNLVVGSGAAGLNAANRLKKDGLDVLLVTEGIKCGTSRNTGSDKQTYYKLSLSGSEGDSVREMASTLFSGRAVDGDIALAEASLSLEGFFNLVSLGVPFPKNRYGEYVGYKTDHDPRARATSIGPYTSKAMYEALLAESRRLGLSILDDTQIIELLCEDNKIRGAVGISRKSGEYVRLLADFVVMATGGPAGIYQNSVYPESQFGSQGIISETGASFVNLTEWQFGLASVKPRWNVSGSYMQVLPRFVSRDEEGREYEFLSSYGLRDEEILSLVFLKGYQWPFDARKATNGSSIIDLMVYKEMLKGRRIFLDFTKNREARPIDFSLLSRECRDYLINRNAIAATPIDRLLALNEPAVAFYLDKGVDLRREYLEIALCAQHNNGGVEVDSNWESSVKNLFVCGEAAGTHGVYRPGGSALNAGQVGSVRCTEEIRRRNRRERVELKEVQARTIEALPSGSRSVREAYDELKSSMSKHASVIRRNDELRSELELVKEAMSRLDELSVTTVGDRWVYYEYRNALLTSELYLAGFLRYIALGGESRGSAIYVDESGDSKPLPFKDEITYKTESESTDNTIISLRRSENGFIAEVRRPRPIPPDDSVFERVWAEYRRENS